MKYYRKQFRPLIWGAKRIFHDFVPQASPLRSDDIFAVSFPKSGNTLLRFLWANLDLLLKDDETIVDYPTLDEMFRAEYEAGFYPPERPRNLPRLIKSHLPWAYLPTRNKRIVFIHRHPGDALCSYFRFLNAYHAHPAQSLTFAEFLRHTDYGLPCWIRHYLGWRNHATVVISYEMLFRQSAEALTLILKSVGLDSPSQQLIEKAAERSALNNVRSLEGRTGKSQVMQAKLRDDATFSGKGFPGRWRKDVGSEDLEWCLDRLHQAGLEQMWVDDSR